jgi:hypothetical protein
MPFQIYSENPATNVESNIRKLPHICPVTPVLGNKSGFNQENIPAETQEFRMNAVASLSIERFKSWFCMLFTLLTGVVITDDTGSTLDFGVDT